jgi:hypothetical protein
MQYLKFKIKGIFTVAVKGQIPPNQIVKWQLKFEEQIIKYNK